MINMILGNWRKAITIYKWKRVRVEESEKKVRLSLISVQLFWARIQILTLAASYLNDFNQQKQRPANILMAARVFKAISAITNRIRMRFILNRSNPNCCLHWIP